MQKVYAKKILITFLAICFYGIAIVQAQVCGVGGVNCSTITQNFNSGAGGFTATPASFVHNPGAGDGDFRVASSLSGTAYALTSPAYTLNTNGVAFIGYNLSGRVLQNPNSSLTSIVVAVLDNAGAVIASETFTTDCNSICSQINNAAFVPGIVVRYRITITTSNGSPGAGNTLIVDDFSNGSAAAPLPVNLKSFDAKRSNNSNTVVLTWETASESNLRGFEIQRKSGDGSFQNIGFVASKSLNGNSSSTLQYSFNDLSNNNSLASQYRILSLDLDGKTKLSIIRTLDGLNGKAKILVYPNPASNGPVYVVFPNAEPRDIQLTDLVGRLHTSWKSYKNNDLVLSKLTPGSYTLRITNMITNKKEAIRLTVTK